jgi:ribosome-binding factor A
VSQRILRVNQLIKKEIAKLLLKEIDFPKDVLVTVSQVDCSPDLIQAKVYISCLPQEGWKRVIKILKENIWSLQKKLDKRLRMRPVPKLIFVKEEKLARAAKVEELLEKIRDDNDTDWINSL